MELLCGECRKSDKNKCAKFGLSNLNKCYFGEPLEIPEKAESLQVPHRELKEAA